MLPLINRPTKISQNWKKLMDIISTTNINTKIEINNESWWLTSRIIFLCFMKARHKQSRPNDLYICKRNYCYDNKLAIQRTLHDDVM